jgi:predicted nuclease with TOPRIM domain
VESFTNLTDKIASLTEENARLQDKFDSISGENRNLLDSLQTRIDQVAQLKSELESVKLVNTQISYIYPNLKNKQTKKTHPKY